MPLPLFSKSEPTNTCDPTTPSPNDSKEVRKERITPPIKDMEATPYDEHNPHEDETLNDSGY